MLVQESEYLSEHMKEEADISRLQKEERLLYGMLFEQIAPV